MDRKTIINFVNKWDSEASSKIIELIDCAVDQFSMHDGGATTGMRCDFEYDIWNASTVDDIVTFCLEWIKDDRYEYAREVEGTEGPISTLYRYEVWEQMEMILNKVKAKYGNPE